MTRAGAIMGRTYPILFAIFFVAASLLPAQGSLSGPSLGFFFDPQAQTIRNLRGIPGSAVAGESLALGYPVANAVFSPAQDYALATGGDGSINLIVLGGPTITTQVVTAVPSAPDHIVISPAGQAAAFAYGTSVKVLTGLPGSLDQVANQVVDIDMSALPSTPSGLAVSDDGAVLLVSIPGDPQSSSPGGVFAFNRDGSGPRFLARQAASDVSFIGASHDALITDGNANSVTALQDAGGAATLQWIFVDDRLPAPSVARVSMDGQRVLVGSVGSAKNGTIALLNRDGSAPLFLACACSPNQMAPLSGSIYQLTDTASGLLWIMDLTQDPRLLFVPIPPVTGDSQ
jgi:hypothetical protein